VSRLFDGGEDGTPEKRPVAAFLGVLEARTRAIADETQADLERRLAELDAQFADEKTRNWHRKRAEVFTRRERDRRSRQAALDALDMVVAWVRDLLATACDAGDAVLNCDHAAELSAAADVRPEQYARMLATAAATRKDLYLNVDQKLALQGMFARFEEVARSA